MREARSGLDAVRVAYLSAIAALMSSEVVAAPVQYFLTVQPIDICADDGTGCAAMNNLSASLNNVGTAGPSVQVGFVSNDINITNQIYNLFGINVVFQPTEQYNNSSFQNLQAVASTTNPGRFDSPQLQQLTQQPGLSQGQAPTMLPPPNPLNTALSPSPTTLNMLFVNSVIPDPTTPGTLFGLSWIGNNGIAIGENAFGNFSAIRQQTVNARADTIAHEIGHNLSLDHSTFGNDPQAPPNSLTAGATRTLPNVTVTDVAMQSNATWLTQIVPGGSVDQLNPTQIAQVINPFGAVDANGNPILNAFLNPIAGIDSTISDPATTDVFSVTFKDAGRTGESLRRVELAAPTGFQLDPSTFRLLDAPAGVVVTPSFLGCTGDRKSQCETLALALTGNPFVLGDRLDYTIEVCAQRTRRGNDEDNGGGGDENRRCRRVSSNDLAGGTYTYQFSDGYQTTSVLQPSGTNLLDANSWNPDPTIPAEIFDEALFVSANAGRLPCVPLPGMTACPPLDLADADPTEEGTAVTPEPSGGAILLAGLGFWCVVYSRHRRRGATRLVHTRLDRPRELTPYRPCAGRRGCGRPGPRP